MTAELGAVVWRGILPWCAAVVGGGLSASVTHLSVWMHYKGLVTARTLRHKDKKVAEKEARDKLEELGTFEPQLKLATWQASVKPLFLFALLFPLGKQLSTNSPQYLACIILAVCALFLSLIHEFKWRETLPDADTWLRLIVVLIMWVSTLVVAVWIASSPTGAP